MTQLRAYLQLVRLPAVFTAIADILLGFLMTHERLAPVDQLGFLLVASAGLYSAGMIFNDVFDREIDARERPGRPIPSGRVSPRSAVVLGVGLIVAALAASFAASLQSLLVAGGLTLCIFTYDGVLKKTPLGPVAMGGCRFLNVMLGASTSPILWAGPQLYAAAGLGIYIVGVTWFARQEAQQSDRRQLGGAAAVVYLGLFTLMLFVSRWPVPHPGVMRAALLIMVLVSVGIGRRHAAALFDPAPQKVQSAVKLMLLSLILLDAALIFFATGDSLYGLGTACLIIPATFLGRWVFVT